MSLLGGEDTTMVRALLFALLASPRTACKEVNQSDSPLFFRASSLNGSALIARLQSCWDKFCI